MTTLLRTFIAVRVPCVPPLRKLIAEVGTQGKAIRAQDADELHVTLKFLGDTPRESVSRITEVLESCAAEEVAFTMRLVGLGAFPHADRPSVVWAGLADTAPLERIAALLEERLEPLGFAPELRDFHPHVTLARVKFRPPPELGEMLARHAETEFGVATVRAVDFFRSDLGPQGAKHRLLATAPLSGASR